MKNLFLKLLSDSKGRFISLGTGAAVGFATKWFASKNLSFDPEFEALMSAGVGFAITYIIDSVVIILQSNGVKRIQDALPPNIASDGVAGPKTLAAVEKAVENQKTP